MWHLGIMCTVHFLQIHLLLNNKSTILCIFWLIEKELHVAVWELYTHTLVPHKSCAL